MGCNNSAEEQTVTAVPLSSTVPSSAPVSLPAIIAPPPVVTTTVAPSLIKK